MVVSFGLQRIRCRSCDAVRQIKIGLADENRRYTKQFERYVLELSLGMPGSRHGGRRAVQEKAKRGQAVQKLPPKEKIQAGPGVPP